ncbi:MAG TPA: hypothetical protein VE225_09065, partial [Rubrobacteraceae bacterium]|nr:hypothetical protein [Rubrobacteraceae bacterium]
MKGIALWALGTALAFLSASGAFLLLADLNSNPAESDPIPRAEASEDQDPLPTIVLELSEDRLEGLERQPGQRLALGVENGSDEELSNLDVALDVSSENTARPDTRSYRQTIAQLEGGESTTVEFEIDLSPPSQTNSAGSEAQPREILETRATTPDG